MHAVCKRSLAMMTLNDNLAGRWAPRALSVLRIVVALLLLQHGTQKLFGFPPSHMPLPHFTLPSMFGFAGIIETIGGVMLLLGLFTRPIAFLLSGEMAVAYFTVHMPRAFWPIQNQGELPVVYCFVFLYFVFAGSGAWSLDAALHHRRAEVAPQRRPHIERRAEAAD